MTISVDLIPEGSRNRPGFANPCMYITIHNTGNDQPGANACMHARYMRGKEAQEKPVSWHYTVDDREVIQHIPDREAAWHAGDGKGDGNMTSIGIEICMNADGDLLQATNKAAQLTAHLMRFHAIPLEHVVQHHHWSGKNCPELIRAGKPYSWEIFLQAVEAWI